MMQEPMMMTLAVILGCLFLGLIMQVIYASALTKAERTLNRKLDLLLEQKQSHGPKLEDLIHADFVEQMNVTESAIPQTKEELEDLLRDVLDKSESDQK